MPTEQVIHLLRVYGGYMEREAAERKVARAILFAATFSVRRRSKGRRILDAAMAHLEAK